MTQREAAIVTMYTGFLIGDIGEAFKYAEELMGRTIWTHQYPSLKEEIREKAKADFIAINIE